MAKADNLTVFYDAACPLCRREIGFYQRREGADKVCWVDVNACGEGEVAPGLSKESALARFHVLDSRGQLISGGPAFARLWQELPAFRIWGRIFGSPPLVWLLDPAYRLFLRLRPRLQAIARAKSGQTDAAATARLLGDLRSDHAGETGAVAIYRGILAVTRDAEVRQFAEHHLETERRHLELIESVLPRANRSRLLALWRVAGFLTGALPALAGRRAVYGTIEAVETFVDRHYAEQLAYLSPTGPQADLYALLERCRLDEIHHRDEARAALGRRPGPLLRLWCRLVGSGSAAAVVLARRL